MIDGKKNLSVPVDRKDLSSVNLVGKNLGYSSTKLGSAPAAKGQTSISAELRPELCRYRVAQSSR